MDFKLFFKEKAITILLLLFGIITIEIFLMAYNVGMFIKIYIPLIKNVRRIRRKIFNYRNYKKS